MASLGIDSGQRRLAFAFQDPKKICVKILHENAFVAILLPETRKTHSYNEEFVRGEWQILTRCGAHISLRALSPRDTFPYCRNGSRSQPRIRRRRRCQGPFRSPSSPPGTKSRSMTQGTDSLKRKNGAFRDSDNLLKYFFRFYNKCRISYFAAEKCYVRPSAQGLDMHVL